MQTAITSTDAERVPFWSALFRDRRMAPALGLGFTSGMPFLLTYSTQSAWLTDAGVPLATIGLLSELTLAYKFKFVWAPFLDQYDPPLIGPVLGRRRGWLLVAILAVMAMLVGIAFGDPGLRAQRSTSCSTAGALRVYVRQRSRQCCPRGPRSAGA
jgi:PAT family beta-lactamase induction signal transducer AmpG